MYLVFIFLVYSVMWHLILQLVSSLLCFFSHNRFTSTFSSCVAVAYYWVSIGFALVAMFHSFVHRKFSTLTFLTQSSNAFYLYVCDSHSSFLLLSNYQLFVSSFMCQTICSCSNLSYLWLRVLTLYAIQCHSKCCGMSVLFCNLFACVSVQCQCVYV